MKWSFVLILIVSVLLVLQIMSEIEKGGDMNKYKDPEGVTILNKTDLNKTKDGNGENLSKDEKEEEKERSGGGGGGGSGGGGNGKGLPPEIKDNYGPSLLFTDSNLKDSALLNNDLKQYIKTIDEIKQKTYEDLKIKEDSCNPCIKEYEYQGEKYSLSIYKGSFISGVHVVPRAKAAIDYVGKKFLYFDYEPDPSFKGDLNYLLRNIIPVNLNHEYTVVIPNNFEWDNEYVFMAVTQMEEDFGNVDIDKIAVKYGIPVVHVKYIINPLKNTCADIKFCEEGETNDYIDGGELLEITSSLISEIDKNGESLLKEENKIFMYFYGMTPYIQSYSGGITFSERFLNKIAPKEGNFGSKVITHGGSKDGGGILHTADIDNRIVAFVASGWDILDIIHKDSVTQQIEDVWGISEEEDYIHFPGSTSEFNEWISSSIGGEKFAKYWESASFVQEFKPELFTIFTYSTHDFHYPITSNFNFWWNKKGFKNNYRQHVQVNYNHGGSYEPESYEPALSDLETQDYTLRHVLLGKDPVDITILEPKITENSIIISGTINSEGIVGGASLFIAESSDLDFSLATGLELPRCKDSFPYEQFGNLGKGVGGPIGPEKLIHGGFAWTYVKSDCNGNPIDKDGIIINDPWIVNNDDVIYLPPFNPDIPKDSGLFTRRKITENELTSGSFGESSQINFEITIDYTKNKKYILFLNAWDKQGEFYSYDFSRKYSPPYEGLFEILPKQNSWEDYKENSKPGNEVDVTIYRDKYGIPYIYSDSDEAAFYALGYSHAEDNLEGVYKQDLRPQGRLSEVFGLKYLEQDEMTRPFKVREIATAYQDEISIDSWKIAKAYADGVNYFVEEHRDQLPEWAKDAPLLNEYDIISAINWNSIRGWHQFYMAYQDYFKQSNIKFEEIEENSLDKKIKFEEMEEGLSNGWAISPWKSTNGYVLLEGDPHMRFSDSLGVERVPNHEALIETPNFHFAGSSVAGTPGSTMFSNEYLTVTGTANHPDQYDSYIEKIADNQYEYDGKNYLLKEEIFTIKVKGMEDKILNVEYTHHGPVMVKKKNGNKVSIKLTGLDIVHSSINPSLELVKAKTINDFKEIYRGQQMREGNKIVATTTGDIYFVDNFVQPIKDESYNWKKEVPGDTSKTEWNGYYSFDSNPQIINPGSGYVASTNTKPRYVTYPYNIIEDNRPDYFYYGTGKVNNERGQRITELLNSDNSITLDKMKSYATDTYIKLADHLMPGVLKALKKYSEEDPRVWEAIDILENWDRFASKDSEGMSLFWHWCRIYKCAERDTPQEEIIFTPLEEEKILEAFLETLVYFQETYSTLHKPWGEIHFLERSPEISLAGGESEFLSSLWITNADTLDEKNGKSFTDSGSRYTRVVELIPNNINIFTMKPFGQSVDPESPHYKDLSVLYGNQEFKELYFYKEDLLQNLDPYNPVTELTYSSLEPTLLRAPIRKDYSKLIDILIGLFILLIGLILAYKSKVKVYK